MPAFNIVVFGGDHCGPEVMKEAIKVLNVVQAEKPEIQFNFDEQLIGGVSFPLSPFLYKR